MNTLPTDPRQSRQLVAQIKRSRVYRDYEQAFREATGLPLALRPVEAFDLPHHGDPKESPFCALVAQNNRSCAGCLMHQRNVEDEARLQPKTLRCFAGLYDSAVPVRVGENLVAFLQTGQVLLHEPDPADLAKTTQQLVTWGMQVDVKLLEEAYLQTRVVTKKQYESILRLLTIFGQHLSALSNQLIVEQAAGEAPTIIKAKALIGEKYMEKLSLAEVAGAVNMSEFYFCKSFKKAIGMTFTDYLARVRVEKVKSMLLNPQMRISEAAFAAGFQSLSQFNRVFRRVAGEAPTTYRDKLHRAA